MSKYKKILKYSTLPIILSAFLVGCSDDSDNKSKDNNDIVGTIEGASVKKQALIDTMMKNYGKATVEELLLKEIVKLEAKKENIVITEEIYNNRYNKIVESYGNEDALFSEMEATGVDKEELKENINNQLVFEMLLKKYMNFDEADLKAFFDENPSLFGAEDKATAYHILLDDEKSANDLISELNKSKDKLETFKQLASKHSKDVNSAIEGGFLDEFNRSAMVKEFSDAAFELEPNTYSTKPVKSEYGYHLIYLADKKLADKIEFEDVRDDVEYGYFSKNYSEFFTPWKNEKFSEYKAHDTLNDIPYYYEEIPTETEKTDESSTEETKVEKTDESSTEETIENNSTSSESDSENKEKDQ